MVNNKEKKIDDLDVNVTQFPARAGFKIHAKLARIFGPVLGALVADSSSTKDLLNKDINLGGLGSAIEKLFNALNEDQALKLVLEILQSTRINGQEINEATFDTIFPGKFDTMYKVIGFVLEVNYGSFFGGNGIGSLLEKVSSKTQ